MNSEEIKKASNDMVRVRDAENADTAAHIQMAVWLKEIAYQLAVMNERNKALSDGKDIVPVAVYQQ